MDQEISGLYKEVFSDTVERKAKTTELQLRIDVDGIRPLNIISGDIFSNLSGTRKYLSSFIFEAVDKVEIPTDRILLIGQKGKFSQSFNYATGIQITIPSNSYPQKAAFQWTNNSGFVSKGLCEKVSKHFRSIQLEHDYEEGVTPLEPYETRDLPSPFPHRSHPISIIDAFSEAGIETTVAKDLKDSVPHPENSGDGPVWTDNELHNAMIKHFTQFKKRPQWKLWLLSAHEYVMSNIKGIMIDRKGKKRIGCAVFQSATGWQTTEEKRMRLFIYVHELGHCFNLHHPWNKPKAESFKEECYATLSWMNYPWTYYSSEKSRGEKAFWDSFRFQFSDSELTHLRHGFRNAVIFGSVAR
jgi:hypothetical protein